MNQTPILLFLDFDGVLHPLFSSIDKHFTNLKLFEESIRQYNNINIVISSSWRHHHTMDEMLAFFAVDIQRRIIDSTRHVEISRSTNRYEEIIDYLKHTNQTQCFWIAIDDSRNEFPKDLPNLVLCNPNKGFDEGAAKVLHQLML